MLLHRVANYLQIGALIEFRTGDGSEQVALAELARNIPTEHDDLPVFQAIGRLLEAYRQARTAQPGDRSTRALLQLAAAVAMSPDVPVPVASST